MLRFVPPEGGECTRLRFSGPRLRYRFLQHVTDARARLRAVDPLRARGCWPLSALASALLSEPKPKSHAVWRLPSHASRETCRSFRGGVTAPSFGASNGKKKEPSSLPPGRACARSEAGNGSMGRAPRVKDTRAGIGAPMRGRASVPLLEKVSSTLCHHAPPSSRLEATRTRPERDQGHRSCASPRRSTLSRWSGCLGRIVSTCAETEIALPLRPTDLSVTQLGFPNVASEEASAFFATRSRPLLTRKARP